MSFGMTQEWKSSLLRPRLVRSDIFIQGLEPDEVEMIREASERGLKPSGFSVAGNTVVLRFERDGSGESADMPYKDKKPTRGSAAAGTTSPTAPASSLTAAGDVLREILLHRLSRGIKCGGQFPRSKGKNRVFGIDLAVSMMDGPHVSVKRRKEVALRAC